MARRDGSAHADGPRAARVIAFESHRGVLLVIAVAAALAFANSPLAFLYEAFLDKPVEVHVGALQIAKRQLLWINDLLRVALFFIVGLEIKREVLEGKLSDPKQVVLPAVAATGGIAVPAAIYVAINAGNPVALARWAIPAATDIAFALGVLTLLGNRGPGVAPLSWILSSRLKGTHDGQDKPAIFQ